MSININDIINNTKEQRVFVTNATRGDERAQIIIAIRLPNGRTDTVTVPPTWIPIELTQQTTKTHLLDSSEFRRALANKLVSFIHAEEADDILSRPDAQRELEKVRALQNMSASVTQLQRSSNAENAVDPALQEVADRAIGNEAGKTRSHLRAEMVLDRLKDEEIQELDALGELRNLGIEHEREVLMYVRDQAKIDKRWNHVFKWARASLLSIE